MPVASVGTSVVRSAIVRLTVWRPPRLLMNRPVRSVFGPAGCGESATPPTPTYASPAGSVAIGLPVQGRGRSAAGAAEAVTDVIARATAQIFRRAPTVHHNGSRGPNVRDV